MVINSFFILVKLSTLILVARGLWTRVVIETVRERIISLKARIISIIARIKSKFNRK